MGRRPPVSVLQLSLHPDGLASRIVNLAEWRGHLRAWLRHQTERALDPVLADLHRELAAYPVRPADAPAPQNASAGIAIPFRLKTDTGLLSFLSTTMVFGTPTDATLSEPAIETFLPADATTADALRHLLPGRTTPVAAQVR